VHPDTYRRLRSEFGESVVTNYFESASGDFAGRLYDQYIARILYPQAKGPTEAACHGYWDSVVNTIPRIFGYETSRDTNHRTTTGGDRPDFIVYINNRAVFRGEEKGPSTSGDPKKELTSKLSEWPRGAPYIVGYSAEYNNVEFWIISDTARSDDWDARYTSIGAFDFDRVNGRLEAANLLVKILRALPLLVPRIGVPLSFQKVTTDHAETESPYGTYVIKKIFDGDDGLRRKLKYIYKAVSGNKHINQMKGKIQTVTRKVKSPYLQLQLTPVGFLRNPTSPSEKKAWLISISIAVNHLHKHNIIHRDIRWPNMIRSSTAELFWFLIDFTDAFVEGHAQPRLLPETDESPPRINEFPTPKSVDVWSIGRALIELPGNTRTESDLAYWMTHDPIPEASNVCEQVS